MTDPIADPIIIGARTAAERLGPEYGPGLAAEVDAPCAAAE